MKDLSSSLCYWSAWILTQWLFVQIDVMWWLSTVTTFVVLFSPTGVMWRVGHLHVISLLYKKTKAQELVFVSEIVTNGCGLHLTKMPGTLYVWTFPMVSWWSMRSNIHIPSVQHTGEQVANQLLGVKGRFSLCNRSSTFPDSLTTKVLRTDGTVRMCAVL